MWSTNTKIDVYEKQRLENDIVNSQLIAESKLDGNRGKGLRLKTQLEKDKNLKSFFIIFAAEIGTDKYPIYETFHEELNFDKAVEIYNKIV